MGLRPGSRVGRASGRPAPASLVAGYFGAALACWLGAAVALAAASGELASGRLAAPGVLLAVHLVGLGFLPLAVAGGVLHVLPTLLRNDPSRWRGRLALPLLCAGPLLAFGIAGNARWLLWPAAVAETAGLVLVAWELLALVLRAPRDRMLLASRGGVALSAVHAAAALAVGAALAARQGQPLFGIPVDRLIAIHLHLAVLGWLTLLLLTVGRTLGPMLALAPAAQPRRAPVSELVFTAGLWLLLAGLALDLRTLELAGAVLAVAAVVRFAALIARVGREHRLPFPEAPLLHFAGGLFFLGQATLLGVAMLFGLDATPQRLAAYVVALLLGWAAGATLGHLGKLLSLSVWTWWPPGPRPKQAALYPGRLWLAEAAAFVAGAEIVLNGLLAGSRPVIEAGAAVLIGSAVAACIGALLTLRAGRPAIELRALRTPSPRLPESHARRSR